MEKSGSLDRLLEGLAWGLLLAWWGLSFVPHLLPNGLDAAGTGIILLGVNAVRRAKGIPVRGLSIGFGILTLIWGALDMSRSVLHLDYRPPVLPILLAVAGIIVVARALLISARSGAARSSGPQAPGPQSPRP